MGQNTIIELNGKQYDAITGAMVGQNRIKATPEKRRTPAQNLHSRVIDGFVKQSPMRAPRPQAPVASAATSEHAPAATPKTAARRSLDVNWPSGKPVRPHQAERSKTLMRHAVQKPTVQLKPALKPAVPSELRARSAADIARPLEKKLSATHIDPLRLSHATHIAKSQHVKHFNPGQPQAHQLDTPHPTHRMTQQAAHHLPTAPAAHHTQQTPDIFEAALARATSHQQPSPKVNHGRTRANRRLASVLAGIAAFVVIGGFITYLNMPSIELRVASMRAGFSASMPGYQPTGYALDNHIKSKDNQVAITYHSGDSSYTVTQIASDWNSQTLLDYYTDNHGTPTQTVQSQGRIIYLYEGTHAAWVNGGVRYEVNGNAALTAKDLVSLATSM